MIDLVHYDWCLWFDSPSQNLSVLKAINPVYAWDLLTNYPKGSGYWSRVFVYDRAEALYSDLGHCGKANIRVGWGFVKLSLLLKLFWSGRLAYSAR